MVVFIDSKSVELTTLRPSKQVCWSLQAVPNWFVKGDMVEKLPRVSLSPGPTSMEEIVLLSLSTASSNRAWQIVRAALTLVSLVVVMSLVGNSLVR